MGYGPFITNELILMEVLAVVAVASSKRLASSIVFFCLQEEEMK